MRVDIIDNSPQVLKSMEEQVEIALETCGLVAEGYAKRLCPVDTGNLRNSITHEVRAEESAVYIGTNVEYGPHVEMGTSKTRAQPFLKPSVMDHIDEYKRILEQSLKE